MRSEAVIENGLVSFATAKNEVGVPSSRQSNERKADDRESDNHSETKLLGSDYNISYIVFVNSVEKSVGFKARRPRYGSHWRLWCHRRAQHCTLRLALDRAAGLLSERNALATESPTLLSLSMAREKRIHQSCGHENQKQTANGRNADDGSEVCGLVVSASGVCGAVDGRKPEEPFVRLHEC